MKTSLYEKEPPSELRLRSFSPAGRLVTQMLVGIGEFALLTFVTWGIGEIRRIMENTHIVSPQLSVGMEWLEYLLFGADALCLVVFVLVEVIRFIRAMCKELKEEL